LRSPSTSSRARFRIRSSPVTASSCSQELPGKGIAALVELGQNRPKARLAFSGFGAANKNLIKRLTDADVDASHINIVSQSRTTAEDAHYAAALPKPIERWLLITAAMHMPRAVGCFRAAGFQVHPNPIEFMTRDRSRPFAQFATGSSALGQLDRAAKEWIGLVAYRLMGKTDALFPGYEGPPPHDWSQEERF
jgi:uncharacterized SAM-binding protein YcdF (DUF218 family)